MCCWWRSQVCFLSLGPSERSERWISSSVSMLHSLRTLPCWSTGYGLHPPSTNIGYLKCVACSATECWSLRFQKPPTGSRFRGRPGQCMPGPETLQPQQHGPSMSYSSSSTTHRQHQGVLDGLNNLAEALSPRGHEKPGYVYIAGIAL